jgi:hypothetical protein
MEVTAAVLYIVAAFLTTLPPFNFEKHRDRSSVLVDVCLITIFKSFVKQADHTYVVRTASIL